MIQTIYLKGKTKIMIQQSGKNICELRFMKLSSTFQPATGRLQLSDVQLLLYSVDNALASFSSESGFLPAVSGPLLPPLPHSRTEASPDGSAGHNSFSPHVLHVQSFLSNEREQIELITIVIGGYISAKPLYPTPSMFKYNFTSIYISV